MSIPNLIRSATTIIENKKKSWPEPQLSAGNHCMTISGLHCWEVTGPALDLMNKIGDSIKELLQNHMELMQQGEGKASTMSFDMWMVGQDIESSAPTIVFSSRSRRQRKFAKALLQESRILEDHPGVRIRTQEKTPAVFRTNSRPETSATTRTIDTDVYLVNARHGSCGALLCASQGRPFTMSGVVKLAGQYHAIVPQHALLDNEPVHLDSVRHTACFDIDDDTGFDSEDDVDLTSKASISSDSTIDSISSSNVSPESDSVFDKVDDISGSTRSPERSQESPFRVLIPDAFKDKLARVPTSSAVGPLDYELCHLETSILRRVSHGQSSEGVDDRPQTIRIQNVTQQPRSGPIIAMTGTTGAVKGSISEVPSHLKMAGCETFQEMWRVELERPTMDGDSGSMVLDAESGDVYGHIVAGDPNSNMAFIVPAYRVIEDIEMRFGHKPEFTLLPDALASESFIARASATLAIDAVRSSRRALDRLSTLSYYSNLCVVFLIGVGMVTMPNQALITRLQFLFVPVILWWTFDLVLSMRSLPVWLEYGLLMPRRLWDRIGQNWQRPLKLLLHTPIFRGQRSHHSLESWLAGNGDSKLQQHIVSETIPPGSGHHGLKERMKNDLRYTQSWIPRIPLARPALIFIEADFTILLWFVFQPSSSESHGLALILPWVLPAACSLVAIATRSGTRLYQLATAFKIFTLFAIFTLGIRALANPESLAIIPTKKSHLLWPMWEKLETGAYCIIGSTVPICAGVTTYWFCSLVRSFGSDQPYSGALNASKSLSTRSMTRTLASTVITWSLLDAAYYSLQFDLPVLQPSAASSNQDTLSNNSVWTSHKPEFRGLKDFSQLTLCLIGLVTGLAAISLTNIVPIPTREKPLRALGLDASSSSAKITTQSWKAKLLRSRFSWTITASLIGLLSCAALPYNSSVSRPGSGDLLLFQQPCMKMVVSPFAMAIQNTTGITLPTTVFSNKSGCLTNSSEAKTLFSEYNHTGVRRCSFLNGIDDLSIPHGGNSYMSFEDFFYSYIAENPRGLNGDCGTCVPTIKPKDEFEG